MTVGLAGWAGWLVGALTPRERLRTHEFIDGDGNRRCGDTRLIGTAVAPELLAAATRLASHAPDWTGSRAISRSTSTGRPGLVMGAFAGTFKSPALRARPAVAVTGAMHRQGRRSCSCGAISP